MSRPTTKPTISKDLYPEFAKFLQDCHDGKASTYTDPDKGQTLYNQQAVDDQQRQLLDRLIEESYTMLELADEQGDRESVEAVPVQVIKDIREGLS